MKQPIEISLAVVLVVGAVAIFWRQAHAPHDEGAHSGHGKFQEDACTIKCLTVAAELGCKNGEKCRELCTKLQAATVCKAQVEPFIACFLQEPSANWTCDDHGAPLLGHVCEPEQNRIADCMMRSNGKL